MVYVVGMGSDGMIHITTFHDDRLRHLSYGYYSNNFRCNVGITDRSVYEV
jgi:hypothetical protein